MSRSLCAGRERLYLLQRSFYRISRNLLILLIFMWVARVLLVNVVAHPIQVAVLEQSGYSERASAIANALQSNGNCSVNVRIYRTF